MSIHERSGHWHYRFKLKGVPYAKTTGLVATKQNRNAAKAKEAHARLEAEKGLKKSHTDDVPFQIASSEFLNWCQSTEYRRKPNTAKRISGSFTSLSEFFKSFTVRNVDAAAIERYKTFRSSEHQVKEVTLRNDLNALSLFFRYAIRAGWRENNPLLGNNKVKRPSGEDALRIHIISAEEEEKYFKAAAKKGNLHDLAKLILLQGARPEEMLSLKKGSYNRERATIQILGGKTKAARRELHLCGESIEIVERRLQLEGHWLFPSVRRPGHHIVQLNNTHDSVCQDAEVSFVLYDFRHTFATRMAQGGIDIATLAAILGHSSLRIVQKYVHPTTEHQRAAMKAYEGFRPKAKPQK